MQPAPIRLQQAIWTTFRAARPVHSSISRQILQQTSIRRSQLVQPSRQFSQWKTASFSQTRFYSDDKKSEVDRKVEDAKQRIDESLESRANNAIHLPGPDEETVKRREEETIIHTLPESSSIVHNPDGPGETAARGSTTTAAEGDGKADFDSSGGRSSAVHDQHEFTTSSNTSSSTSQPSPLPSQLAARYSHVRERFTDFMENFQVHIFTASKRLNELTGYSSIERLKKDIEAQEQHVRQARQHVKDSRDAYQAAISNRSDTQREVNDLLHRKHAWSPRDLERFTELYRSDHANEQAENQAQDNLGRSEASYEEASTKLSKSILARYHEEQVWSDKIRQMSTWGTWGLMGLNVLLFVVFQILIEPWRRRRLVRGFEEKVQAAMREQAADHELRTISHIERVRGEEPIAAAATAAAVVEATPMEAISTPESEADGDFAPAAEAVADLDTAADITQRTNIEQAAETITNAEIGSETLPQPHIEAAPESQSQLDTHVLENGEGSVLASNPVAFADLPESTSDSAAANKDLPSIHDTEYKDLPFVLGSYTRRYFDQARIKARSLFDEKATVTITQRDLTARALEGAFFGAVGAVTLFWFVGVGAIRGR